MRCCFCDVEISPSNDSGEHIIPNAIGGRKKIRGFICKKCNSTTGSLWDIDLSSQFGWFSLIFRIKRQRGNVQPVDVTTCDGRNLKMQADGSFILAAPFYGEIIDGDKVQIRIQAQNVRQARKMMEGVKKKFPKADLDEILANMEDRMMPLDSLVKLSFTFGGANYGRSVVKTALALAFANGIVLSKASLSLKYLLEGVPEGDAPYGLFYSRDLVENRDRTKIFHCVALKGDPARKTLIAYVEYFSFVRYIVLLSNTYEGKEISSYYAVDPIAGKEVPLQVSLNLTDKELVEILAGIYDEDAYIQEVRPVLDLALKCNHMYGRKQATLDAVEYAKKRLNLDEDTPMNEEILQQFLRYFCSYLVEYRRAQNAQSEKMKELIEKERNNHA